MKSALAKLPLQERESLKKQDRPGFVPPMLATLSDEHFNHPDWIFERKLDGERCLAVIRDGEVKLYSRNQKPLDDHYPEIGEALATEGPGLVLDGEVVTFSHGVTSFSRLQGRMQMKDPQEARRSGIKVYYYVFDILHYDNWDLTGLSQRERKKVLRKALKWQDPLRYTPHRNAEGRDYYQEACRRGWEGVIAKRADAAYASGRGKRWLKFKCVGRQELVIGGYTPPEGSRIKFGALLLGYYDRGKLRYAGKVGTGFDRQTLRTLGAKLAGLRREQSPFADEGLPGEAIWVEPKLVCEVGFTEWTEANKLRHPRYLGLREDKDAREVHRESSS